MRELVKMSQPVQMEIQDGYTKKAEHTGKKLQTDANWQNWPLATK